MPGLPWSGSSTSVQIAEAVKITAVVASSTRLRPLIAERVVDPKRANPDDVGYVLEPAGGAVVVDQQRDRISEHEQ